MNLFFSNWKLLFTFLFIHDIWVTVCVILKFKEKTNLVDLDTRDQFQCDIFCCFRLIELTNLCAYSDETFHFLSFTSSCYFCWFLHYCWFDWTRYSEHEQKRWNCNNYLVLEAIVRSFLLFIFERKNRIVVHRR